MRLLPAITLAATLFASFTLPAKAAETLIGYWDVNGNYDRTSGLAGYLDAMLGHVGIGGRLGPGIGSEIFLREPSVAGASIRFDEFATVALIGIVEISQLDFSDYTSPTFSFAMRKGTSAALFEFFRLEYNTGSGWHTATTINDPLVSDYVPFSYTFASGLLDGQSNVALRLIFEEFVSFNSFAEFDNLTITAQAIPEPRSMVLLAGAGLMAAGVAVRRKRRAA